MILRGKQKEIQRKHTRVLQMVGTLKYNNKRKHKDNFFRKIILCMKDLILAMIFVAFCLNLGNDQLKEENHLFSLGARGMCVIMRYNPLT